MLRNLSSLHSLFLSLTDFSDIGNAELFFDLSSLSQLSLFGANIRMPNPNQWLQIPNKLPHLESLDLSDCFAGYEDEIPLTLSPINSSSSLTELFFDANVAIPSIYLQWLSNIAQNIRFLCLFSNNLQRSTLADFENIISLENLYLSNLHLKDIFQNHLGICVDWRVYIYQIKISVYSFLP